MTFSMRSALSVLLALGVFLAGPAWATAPTAVASVSGSNASGSQTLADLGSASCAPGQVAVAAIAMTGGAGGTWGTTFVFGDSTDSYSSASWTLVSGSPNASSSDRGWLLKKKLTSAYDATTTFKVTYAGTGTPYLVVSCFTDGTAVTNVANDLNSATSSGGGTTSATLSPTGPVAGTSYQWAYIFLSNNLGGEALDTGTTTGGWTQDQKMAVTGAGIVTYYRAAGGSTASTTLRATWSNALYVAGWEEVQASGAALPTTSACPNQLLLGEC